MLNVAVAPCSPFSVSRDLMRESAALARSYGVRLHTHLAENDHDIAYSREKFNCTPVQYVQDLGWLGADVWHAHCVKLDDTAIGLFASSRTGVAHCPCSNMRLGSGIAPVRRLVQSGGEDAIIRRQPGTQGPERRSAIGRGGGLRQQFADGSGWGGGWFGGWFGGGHWCVASLHELKSIRRVVQPHIS